MKWSPRKPKNLGPAVSSPLRVGDRIKRIKDGRLFEISFLNWKADVPVFSAKSADGEWSDWGGPTTRLIDGQTFELVSRG